MKTTSEICIHCIWEILRCDERDANIPFSEFLPQTWKQEMRNWKPEPVTVILHDYYYVFDLYYDDKSDYYDDSDVDYEYDVDYYYDDEYDYDAD